MVLNHLIQTVITWNPPPRKMGGGILLGLGGPYIFTFSGGLSQIGGLKFSTLFQGDNRVFSTGGMEVPLPHWSKITCPSQQEKSPC